MNTIGSSQFDSLVNSINIGRPFLVGVNNLKSGRSLTVHASRSSMTRQQSRRLALHLKTTTDFSRCKVKRYGQNTLGRAKSLEEFLAPYSHDELVFDPTGAFARAENLLNFARTVRQNFGDKIVSIFWDGRKSTVYIVLNFPGPSEGEAHNQYESACFEWELQSILHDTCGANATRFVKGIKVGFYNPPVAATPIDRKSFRKRKSFVNKLKYGVLNSAIATAFGISTIAAANADENSDIRAVSGLNGEIAIMGGSRDGAATFITEGALTFPIGENFGARIDVTAGISNNAFIGGGAGHLFWRDPRYGLIGIAGGYSIVKPAGVSSSSQGIGVVAGEGELYFDKITLSGLAGYQFGDAAGDDGFLGRLDIEWYPSKDILFSVGLETNPTFDTLARVGFEYRPGIAALPGLTFFAEGAFGDNDYSRVYGGIRIYFGESESLIDRHRFDTFRSQLLSTRITDSARRYGN